MEGHGPYIPWELSHTDQKRVYVVNRCSLTVCCTQIFYKYIHCHLMEPPASIIPKIHRLDVMIFAVMNPAREGITIKLHMPKRHHTNSRCHIQSSSLDRVWSTHNNGDVMQ